MKEIDLSTWPRREHFQVFRRADLPFYNVNVNLDITGVRKAAKRRGVPFTRVMIHLVLRTANAIENFRYRLHGETVVLHDVLHPSFAHMKDGEELFRMIAVPFDEELQSFSKACEVAIAASNSYFDPSFAGRDYFVFLSPLPLISFTGTDHTLSLNRGDGIPRITWGKIFAADNRELLPFNIQVNHMFVDGLHVGRFFQRLETEVAGFLAASA